MTDPKKPSLDVALRRLDVEVQSGHCGEGNIERMVRNHHNDAVDVVMDFVVRATDEEGLARVLHEAECRITGYDVPWDAEVESERQQTVSIARALVAHIKGEKKDG